MRFETGRSELRFESRSGQLGLGGAPRVVRSEGTVSIVKIVSLSPRVENLKVKKVIKVSYLNQESRQGFECFGIPMHMNISYVSRIRILIVFLALYYNGSILFTFCLPSVEKQVPRRGRTHLNFPI